MGPKLQANDRQVVMKNSKMCKLFLIRFSQKTIMEGNQTYRTLIKAIVQPALTLAMMQIVDTMLLILHTAGGIIVRVAMMLSVKKSTVQALMIAVISSQNIRELMGVL